MFGKEEEGEIDLDSIPVRTREEKGKDKEVLCPDSETEVADDEMEEYVEGSEAEEADSQSYPDPPKKKAKRSGFRIQAKNIFCTWPKCDLPPEDVLKQMENKWGERADYIVARETHQVNLPSERRFAPFLSATEFMKNTDAQNKAHFERCTAFFEEHYPGLTGFFCS